MVYERLRCRYLLLPPSPSTNTYQGAAVPRYTILWLNAVGAECTLFRHPLLPRTQSAGGATSYVYTSICISISYTCNMVHMVHMTHPTSFYPPGRRQALRSAVPAVSYPSACAPCAPAPVPRRAPYFASGRGLPSRSIPLDTHEKKWDNSGRGLGSRPNMYLVH